MMENNNNIFGILPDEIICDIFKHNYLDDFNEIQIINKFIMNIIFNNREWFIKNCKKNIKSLPFIEINPNTNWYIEPTQVDISWNIISNINKNWYIEPKQVDTFIPMYIDNDIDENQEEDLLEQYLRNIENNDDEQVDDEQVDDEQVDDEETEEQKFYRQYTPPYIYDGYGYDNENNEDDEDDDYYDPSPCNI
jgi:hypothetical protein